MDTRQPNQLLDAAVRITEAALGNSTSAPTVLDKMSGSDVAEFLESVYGKLVELYAK